MAINTGGHLIRVLNERWKFVSSLVGDSLIILIKCRRHLIAAIQLAVRLASYTLLAAVS